MINIIKINRKLELSVERLRACNKKAKKERAKSDIEVRYMTRTTVAHFSTWINGIASDLINKL